MGDAVTPDPTLAGRLRKAAKVCSGRFDTNAEYDSAVDAAVVVMLEAADALAAPATTGGAVERARDVLLGGYAEELVGIYGGEPRRPSTQRRYERDVAAFTEDVDALILAVREESRR